MPMQLQNGTDGAALTVYGPFVLIDDIVLATIAGSALGRVTIVTIVMGEVRECYGETPSL